MTTRLVRLNRRISNEIFWVLPTIIFSAGTLRPFIRQECLRSLRQRHRAGPAPRRLALRLLNLADRFSATDPVESCLTLNISHEVLAGIVGASRQQVTEYLNNFDREKIIFRDGRRIIVNMERLGKILEGLA